MRASFFLSVLCGSLLLSLKVVPPSDGCLEEGSKGREEGAGGKLGGGRVGGRDMRGREGKRWKVVRWGSGGRRWEVGGMKRRQRWNIGENAQMTQKIPR